MPTTDENPKLQPWIWSIAAAAVLVQFIGVGLLLLPEVVIPKWPWKVPPFNARFLGAIYLSEAAASLPLLFANRWSPGRLYLVAACLFTTIASLGSLIHASEFIEGRRTWLWFFLYIGYAMLTGYALYSNRNRAAPPPLAVTEARRRIYRAAGLVLALYGLALFVAPSIAAAFWPWPVNAMHASIYSAVFIAGGCASLLASQSGAREEFRTLGLSQLVFALAAIAGLFLADQAVSRVVWLAPGTLLWLILFTAMGALGVMALTDAARKGNQARQ